MIYHAFRRFLPAVVFLIVFSAHNSSQLKASGSPVPSIAPNMVVIGFMGGFVGRNNSIHQEVVLADHLRKDYAPEVAVRIFENHAGPIALREIFKLLDADHDGTLSAAEKKRARIVLYGHSWGASEAVNTARSLAREGVGVLLTIQVDSVGKPGENDRLIPANVAQAINLYQTGGWLHGVRKIFAADPERTKILGNFQFDYKKKSENVAGYPWYARLFMRPHIEIESDPVVWSKVESLIREKVKELAATDRHG